MITVARYQAEPDESIRTRVRMETAASIVRQRGYLARLYAAEAVLALHEHLPTAARITFTVREDELDGQRATVDVVAVFDATGAVLYPGLDEGIVDALEDDSTVGDMLAAAAEQGGADFFSDPGDPPYPFLPRATHGLTVADLTGAYDEDRQAALAALNLRTLSADPHHADRSAHVVLEVLGVTIGVRHRAGDTYVHLDTDTLPAEFRPLVVQVDNSGENVHGG